MPLDITFSKTGLTNTNTQPWSDAMVDRVIAYAQATYLNADGTQPGQNAALNRLAKAIAQGIRDNVRNKELADAKAAVPQPPDIPVT